MSITLCDIKEKSPSLSEAVEGEPLDQYTAKIKEKLLLLEREMSCKIVDTLAYKNIQQIMPRGYKFLKCKFSVS